MCINFSSEVANVHEVCDLYFALPHSLCTQCATSGSFFQLRNETRNHIFYDCNSAIAAGRVPQSLVSFMQEAVTQIQSSILGPLTAFRWPADTSKALDRFNVMTVRFIWVRPGTNDPKLSSRWTSPWLRYSDSGRSYPTVTSWLQLRSRHSNSVVIASSADRFHLISWQLQSSGSLRGDDDPFILARWLILTQSGRATILNASWVVVSGIFLWHHIDYDQSTSRTLEIAYS